METSPAHSGNELGGEPLLGEDAIALEVLADQGEPLAVALLPADEDAGVWTGCFARAADPDVSAARWHGWDGCSCPLPDAPAMAPV